MDTRLLIKTKTQSSVLMKCSIKEGANSFFLPFCYQIHTAVHVCPGCKESQFYSLPFGKAVVSMYQPKSYFN